VLSYIIRRLVVAIPVIWGTLTLLFILFLVVPGDPVDQLAGAGGTRAVTPAVRANVEARYGLDQPVLVQYGRYLGNVVTGDLGESYANRRTVNEILGERAPASLRLAFWAIIIEILIGITAGVVSAVKQYSFLDALTTISTTMMVAVPVFVLGTLLQYGLGVWTFQNDMPEWMQFPVQGIGPDSWTLFFIPTGNQWRYVVLPAVTLAAVSTAVVARMMRATMLEVTRADFIRTAMAKGLSRNQALLRHGLRNAMIPVVTLIGLDLANIIGAAILTETVFSWPGMGSAIAGAIIEQDAPVVLGLSIVLVLAYVLINLAVDVSYGFFDPRVRVGSRRA
jgi:ABC-type dipeptide/oligopeptide/nickel transport system permease component